MFIQMTSHQDPRGSCTLFGVGFLFLESEKCFYKCAPSVWFFSATNQMDLPQEKDMASCCLLHATKVLLKDNNTPWEEGKDASLNSYYE